MLETVRKEVNRKLQQVKENPVLCQYLKYIGISILLGVGFKYGYDGFVSLIKPYLDILHISSMSSIDHSYLFSTSAGLLFAGFSILLVLLTVFIQVSHLNVSADILRSKETKYLIILYFSTIIFNLMMLEATFQFPIVALTLTIICILSLYPFLRSIADKLMYDVEMVKLYVEIPSNISTKNEPFTRVGIMSLSKICERSIIDDRWVAFIGTMSILEEITKMAKEHQMTEVIKIIGISYSKLLELLIEDKPTKSNRNSMFMIMEGNIHTYVSNYSDMVDAEFINTILVGSILNTVIKRIKDGFEEDNLNESIVILCYKSYSELKKRDTDNYQIERWIIDSLGDLAKESYNNNLSRSLTISIGALFTIGAKACLNEKSVYSRPLVINKLEDIEEYIQPDNFEKVYNDFNRITHISWAFNERELEQYFDKFKDLYDKISKKYSEK